MPKLLVIDNYDSFTFNLVQMFRLYPLEIFVYRNDDISIVGARDLSPDYILISPGPRDPAHAGISVPLIEAFFDRVPILGVCLGMQCINEAFGGQTIRAATPVHGKTSRVYHDGEGVFKTVPSPFPVARYHSLTVKTVTGPLKVTAKSDDHVIMGMSHPQFPLHGVQFHPESFLTENGFTIVENFLELGALRGNCNPMVAENVRQGIVV